MLAAAPPAVGNDLPKTDPLLPLRATRPAPRGYPMGWRKRSKGWLPHRPASCLHRLHGGPGSAPYAGRKVHRGDAMNSATATPNRRQKGGLRNSSSSRFAFGHMSAPPPVPHPLHALVPGPGAVSGCAGALRSGNAAPVGSTSPYPTASAPRLHLTTAATYCALVSAISLSWQGVNGIGAAAFPRLRYYFHRNFHRQPSGSPLDHACPTAITSFSMRSSTRPRSLGAGGERRVVAGRTRSRGERKPSCAEGGGDPQESPTLHSFRRYRATFRSLPELGFRRLR